MKKDRQQTLPYTRIARVFITPFLFSVKTLPLWFLRGFSWVVTAIYYPFFVERRHNYQANLKRILGPDTPNFRLFATTFRMCVNYAYYLIDLFRFEDVGEVEIKRLLSEGRGYDRIQEALAGGKGAIVLTAHLGNWEFGGIVLSKLGHPVNIVYYPDGSKHIEEGRTRARLMQGVKEIRLDPERFSVVAMMRALERGEVVALQGDKLYHDSGMKMPFFGEDAYFPRGPVLLAMLSGAPILPSFVVMDRKFKYNIMVDEPIYVANTGDRDSDVRAGLRQVVAVLEKYIGRYHDQWYCFTRFWGEGR